MEDLDYALALELQEQFQNEEAAFHINKENQHSPNISSGYSSASSTKGTYQKTDGKIEPTNSLNDPAWEVIDPTPDIFALFGAFNERFFWGKLSAVEVKWSPQMTSCAGVCSYQGRGGLCSVRLSSPLLKLRPRSDLVNTLLHEMIHAYLFVTANNRDRDGHGPEFHKHMDRINKEAGTKITVYHTFHDEVRLYQQHWWRCDGPCRERKPFWGYIKRARNRAPGPTDFWWGNHQAECGGTFQKIKEPENYVDKSKKSKNAPSGANSKSTKPGAQDIRSFFPQPGTSSTNIVDLRDLDKSSGSTSNSTAKTNSNIIGFSDLTSPDAKNNVRNTANPGKTGGNNSGSGKGRVLGGNTAGSSNARSGGVAGRGGFIGGGLKNKGSSTLVIQPKTQNKTDSKNVDANETTKKPDNPLRIDEFQAFKTNGQVLGGQPNERSRSRLLAMYTERQRERQALPASPTQSTRPPQNPSVDGRRTVDCSSPPRSSVNPLSNFKMRSLAAIGGAVGTGSSKPTGGNLGQKWLASPSTSDRESDPDFNFRTSAKRRSLSPNSADKKPSPNKRPLFSDANTDTVSHDVVSPKRNKISRDEESLRKGKTSRDIDSPKKDTVSCPVCSEIVKRGALSNHLETCTGLTSIPSKSVISDSDDEDIFVEKRQNTRSEKPISKKPTAQNPFVKKSDSKSKEPEPVISILDDEEVKQDDSKSSRKLVISISDDEDDVTQDDRFNVEEYGRNSNDPEVPCPCCNQLVPSSRINQHLDVCLTELALKDYT